MLNAKLQCLRKTAKKSHKKQLEEGLHYVCCSLKKCSMGSRNHFKNAEVWSKMQYLLLEKQISEEKKNSQAFLTAALLLYDSVINKYILTI